MLEFTREQEWAITARGGTVLVSAAAGSGKTAVLIERIMRLITDPDEPVDADSLLVVTFTKAAAAEMRARLSSAIAKRINERPDDARLRRQKLLVRKAHIDTIDSFCTSCLREFFAQAGVAPDFRIVEGAEKTLMRAEALAETLAEGYESGSGEFTGLLGMLGDEKGESPVERAILTVESFVTAFPDPDEKLNELTAAYTGDDPVDSVWGKFLLGRCVRCLDWAAGLAEEAVRLSQAEPILVDKYLDAVIELRDMVVRMRDYASAGEWDALYFALQSFAVPKVKSVTGKEFVPGKDRVMELRKIIKSAVEKAAEMIPVTRDDFASDTKRLAPAVAELCRLTGVFRERYAAKKSERKMLDFADLEHTAAKLFFVRDGGVYRRTAVAEALSARFTHIMIDEYQDTNYTQDLIFRAISREDGDVIGDGINMFIVGDVKQSIYGFRKAVPQIFIDRLNRYADYDPDSPVWPARIILGKNFRSRREVTGITNFVFEQLMSPERGGIAYDDTQKLFPGRTDFPPADNMQAELKVLCGSAGDDEDTAAIVEARYCARMIRRMIDGGFEVTAQDGKSLRPAKYSDFCIMRRSVGGDSGDAFVAEMNAAGIPVRIGIDSGFFAAPEIRIMLSLLRAVSNPLLDIQLAAALRSPVFGFDCGMLAGLRSGKNKKIPLYSAMTTAAAEGSVECTAALGLLAELRDLAAAMPTDRLISAIYRRTGFLAAVQAAPGGDAAWTNLLMLAEHARSLENTGVKGLPRFIAAVDRMIEQGEDYKNAASEAAGSCVSICTMHGVKGLEFPICILTGLGAKKNDSVIKTDVPTNNRMGVAMKLRDDGRRVLYSTVQHEAVRRAQYSDEVDEELRVLYVAMTRAVDKLIMVATSQKNSSADSMLSSAAALLTPDGIAPFPLELSPTFGKWLLACALRHPDMTDLRETAKAEDAPVFMTDVPLRAELVDADNESLMPDKPSGDSDESEQAQPDPALSAELAARMDWRYPYAGLREVPAKVTASATHARTVSRIMTRPSFMTAGGLSPTERGTALHRFMQFCRFDAARTDPLAELDRLTKDGFLTQREGAAVDVDKVTAFFDRVGMMIDRAERIEREWRFSVLLSRELLPLFTDADPCGEPVVLQGECDLLLIGKDSAVIVDYKTDVSRERQYYIDNYSPQLRLYADAVRQSLGMPVSGCVIYAFSIGEVIDIDI